MRENVTQLIDVHVCKERAGVGVCVTGEARSFALHSVRKSLREFLHAVGAVAVRMHIARRASSSMGWTHGHDKALRGDAVRNITFAAEPARIEREFARWNAAVTLFNASDCEQPTVREDECCQLAQLRNTSRVQKYPPGAYLQYAAFAQCVRELVSEQPCLSHVVRTRPDNLYLNVSTVAAMSLAADYKPALIRKGEHGLYAANPGDQYLVAPAATALDFFSSFDEPIRAACRRGIATGEPAWERLAWDPVPELTWQKRRPTVPHVLRSFPIVQVDVLGRPVCNVGLYHWRGGSDVTSREDCRARSLRTLERLNLTSGARHLAHHAHATTR